MEMPLEENGSLRLDCPDEATLVALGNRLAREKLVGLGGSSTPEGQFLLRAVLSGVTAAGGQAMLHELSCPVQGSWAADREGWPVSLFAEAEEGQPCRLYLFDASGLPPEGDWREERTGVDRGAFHTPEENVDCVTYSPLTERRWAEETVQRSAIRRGIPRHITVAVGKSTPADRAVRQALLALGCTVEERWRPGIPAFFAGEGGFLLSAQDETGSLVEPGQLLALLTLIEMENGSGEVAVPEGASAAVDLVAAGYRGRVLRLGLDGGEARERYAAQPWLWSAPAGAVRLCARMGTAGQKLMTLLSKIPRFGVSKQEIPLFSDREQVLEAMAREQTRCVQGAGLRLRQRDGWVYLLPTAGGEGLKVVAEGPDLELAGELCALYARRAVAVDTKLREKRNVSVQKT